MSQPVALTVEASKEYPGEVDDIRCGGGVRDRKDIREGQGMRDDCQGYIRIYVGYIIV